MRLFAFGNKQTEQKKTAHQLSKEASIEAHQVWICAHRKTIRIRHTRKKNVVEERHRKNERISNKQPSTYIYLHILHYNIRPKWATKNYRRSLTRSLSSLGTPLTWVLVLSLRFPCSRLCVYFLYRSFSPSNTQTQYSCGSYSFTRCCFFFTLSCSLLSMLFVLVCILIHSIAALSTVWHSEFTVQFGRQSEKKNRK